MQELLNERSYSGFFLFLKKRFYKSALDRYLDFSFSLLQFTNIQVPLFKALI